MLLEELSGAGPDLVLVLDDYHLAETVTVNSTVGAFLRYRPERVQLVISTRSDPALGIARLRSAGDLLEIRAEHLRFDSTEVVQFLTAVGIVGLSDDEATRLTASTGGWPAPLRLVALLVQDEEPSAFVDSFAAGTKPIVEYLTTDVLEMLEPDVQDFVLRTSILTRMSGALCDDVVGRTGSGKLLAELERSSLFVSVDAGGVWYTQHHLFAEAMRLELTEPSTNSCRPFTSGRPSGSNIRATWSWRPNTPSHHGTSHSQPGWSPPRSRRWPPRAAGPPCGQAHPVVLARSAGRPRLAWVRATSDSFSHDLDGAEQWLLTARKGVQDAAGALSLPLGYRVEMLSALVGVNDVDRAEEAALRALGLAPGPIWEGGALVGLGQAQYLRGAVAGARDPAKSGGADPGRPSEPSRPRDRQPCSRGVRRRLRRRCGPPAGSGARDDGRSTTSQSNCPPAHGPRGACPSGR